MILRNEYSLFLKELSTPDVIDISKGSFDRDMRTDPALYAELKRKIEAGEDLDITLPDDSNLPRYSTKFGGSIKSEIVDMGDYERVKPEEIFGRVFGGV